MAKLEKKLFLLLFFLFLAMVMWYGCAHKKAALKEQNVSITTEPKIKRETSETPSRGTKATQAPSTKTAQQEKTRESGEGSELEKKTLEKKEAESIIQVIEELETCYKTNDFKKWQSLLTQSYREQYNDPNFLASHGWDANDLHSFFNLLVKTRKKGGISSLQISRVEFVSPAKAYVWVILDNKEFPKPQHTFIKIGDSWYKGLPEEGD